MLQYCDWSSPDICLVSFALPRISSVVRNPPCELNMLFAFLFVLLEVLRGMWPFQSK